MPPTTPLPHQKKLGTRSPRWPAHQGLTQVHVLLHSGYSWSVPDTVFPSSFFHTNLHCRKSTVQCPPKNMATAGLTRIRHASTHSPSRDFKKDLRHSPRVLKSRFERERERKRAGYSWLSLGNHSKLCTLGPSLVHLTPRTPPPPTAREERETTLRSFFLFLALILLINQLHITAKSSAVWPTRRIVASFGNAYIVITYVLPFLGESLGELLMVRLWQGTY
jgi:hypothetical protein